MLVVLFDGLFERLVDSRFDTCLATVEGGHYHAEQEQESCQSDQVAVFHSFRCFVMQLTAVDERSGDPTRLLLEDRFLQVIIALWAFSFFVIIYLLK